MLKSAGKPFSLQRISGISGRPGVPFFVTSQEPGGWREWLALASFTPIGARDKGRGGHGFHLWLDSGHSCRGLGGQNSEPRARKIGIEVIFFEVSVTLSGRYLYNG